MMSRVYSDPLLISSGLTCGSQRFSTPTLVPIYQQPKYSKYFNFIQKSPQNLDWKYLQIIKYKILKIMIMINSLQDHTKQQNYFHARLKKFIHMYATSLRQWSNARAVSARCSDLFDNFQFSSWNRKSTISSALFLRSFISRDATNILKFCLINLNLDAILSRSWFIGVFSANLTSPSSVFASRIGQPCGPQCTSIPGRDIWISKQFLITRALHFAQ